jgi:hypothetical protein
MQPGHDVTCTYTAWHWDAAPPEAPARLSRSVRDPVRDRRPSSRRCRWTSARDCGHSRMPGHEGPHLPGYSPAWAARQYRSHTIRSRGPQRGGRHGALAPLPRLLRRVHRDRAAERRSGGGSTVADSQFLKVLLIPAAVVVLASLV